MLVAPVDVEVLRLREAVVGGDELAYGVGQMVLLGHAEAAADVVDDDLCALLVGEAGVGVGAVLIFGEEDGVLQFAYVVVEGAGTDELAVGADAVGGRCGQVGHLHAVLEGAGGLFGEGAQQFAVDVGEFDERHVGGEAEQFLVEVEERIGEEEQHGVDDEGHAGVPVELMDVADGDELHGAPDDDVREQHDQCAAEELRALGEFGEAEDGAEACHELEQHELVGAGHDERGDEDDDEVRHEGGARVEEHADHERSHGEGDDHDLACGGDEGCRHGEEDDLGGEEQDGRRALGVVAAVAGEEHHEREHEEGDEDGLAEQREFRAGTVVVLIPRLAVGEERLVGFLVDDVATADDLLSGLDGLLAAHDGVASLLTRLGGAQAVEEEVGVGVVVEVAVAEDVPAVGRGVGLHDVLVGFAGREGVAEVSLRGHVAADDLDARDAVAVEGVEGGVDDAVLIDLLEAVGDGGAQRCRHEGRELVAIAGVERLEQRVADGRLDDVVRLDGGCGGIALTRQHLVRLHHGKLPGGGELVVAPGLVEREVVTEGLLVRKEKNDDGDDGQRGQHPGEDIMLVILIFHTSVGYMKP